MHFVDIHSIERIIAAGRVRFAQFAISSKLRWQWWSFVWPVVRLVCAYLKNSYWFHNSKSEVGWLLYTNAILFFICILPKSLTLLKNISNVQKCRKKLVKKCLEVVKWRFENCRLLQFYIVVILKLQNRRLCTFQRVFFRTFRIKIGRNERKLDLKVIHIFI